MATNLQTITNTNLNYIKRQSVSLEKSNRTLIDVYCIEIDINDYMVKEPNGSFTEKVTTYTKQKPGGDEYQATFVRRFFKGYPYSNGKLIACKQDGEILYNEDGSLQESVDIVGTIKEDEFLGQFSFMVKNDQSEANLYIEKVLYPNPDKTGEPIVKHFAYIDVYESEYFDKKTNTNKTTLNFQTRVEFVSDSKVVNLTNRLNKILAQTAKFKAEVGIYKSNYFQKGDNGEIQLFTERDLI